MSDLAPPVPRPSAPAAQQPAGGSSWAPALLVLIAMLLTAVSLTAVFSDTVWLAQVVVMLVLVLFTGALFRTVPVLRASGLTVIGQFAVATIAAVYLCVPDSLAGGFVPVPASFVDLFGTLAAGIDDIYATTAPAPSTPGFRAILTVGFGLVAMLVDGLVSDIRTPKVAGVLLLLVYIVPVLLAPAQLRWWHFACIAAAFLLLMLAPQLTERVRGIRLPVTAMLAGALAIALGIGLPILLPDIAVRPDRNLSAQGDLTVINPFLDLKEDLTTDSDSIAFTYSSDDPLAPPIRLTSVSQFDGRTWMPAEFDLDPFAVAVDGLPGPVGASADTPAVERSAAFRIQDLDQQHLPAPYSPRLIEGVSRRWIFDPSTLTIVGNGEITRDAQYSVDYVSVEPTARMLDEAPSASATQFEDMLALPEDLPDVIAQTASEVTAGAETDWQRAAALQAFFRSGEFEYSVDAPEEASGDALADFLSDRKGYCVQFSGAMTAMARSLGIPARIGVGFTAGTAVGEGEYEVRIDQAHAWPELYFEGAGWVRFEPTPGGPAGTPPPWTEAGGEDSTEDEPAPEETPTPEETEAPQPVPEDEETEAPAEDSAASPGASPSWGWLITAAAVLLALLAAPAVSRLVIRARRLHRPADAERVWAEVRATATDHGRRAPAAQTVAEQITELSSLFGTEDSGARSRLAGLGRAVDEARYSDAASGGPGHPVDDQEAHAVVRDVRRALGREHGSVRSVLAHLWPASIFRR